MEKYLKDHFNDLYDYLEENTLPSKHQSSFCSHDLCISQLLSVLHGVYSLFDSYPILEIHGISWVYLKPFDKVWYEGSIYKVISMGISGSLLTLLESF